MKLICIGRNYTDHIEELENERPEDPVVFIKPDTSILLKKQPFFIPDFSDDIHHEVEVLVKINKVGKYIDKKFAHKYYNEVSLGIDFTARDLQAKLKAKGLPWEKAKAFDGAAVIGKWVSKDEYEDIDAIDFRLEKNSETAQHGNTRLMLWKIDELIEYVSKYFTLKIGDIIFTGTPAGVGVVKPNDILTGYINNQQFFSIKVK
ncbi:2-keto-4-pentenoate hydratase/2-oxohepta-3-ene-1,7-dioic acid hydratase in catechol pathway [Aquimarina sp. EL_43]|uniref:fumarylacetoacetate hydrolase family protein n=1 Tax=Aquimarina TaxID=290174 RepID=UPI00046ECA08|nr:MULTISPECIES: fumarylacetoacetate hydrolase family protein [Aquimarina]MBG6132414.1 2-keto-4-pentenoate hydratase/2-oxohepta-3-ene-1,7-dioic acid hydratase in catechol pathway [Aquimarina sp. EL_35]MBG6152545.1 2-keto-4-pentenoate hydratase/2-oxohepta-3-ene-1,7-dioic acid hydratase in catechol pathway [Aquimarina sp. EL_32]MBG6170528.1 2-keto-4-pentenoate hydratase/2-oxohepta-3-ene-1,7-dioic acid hydratase in catechol pathway [Aquimarina sp. EL_43]